MRAALPMLLVLGLVAACSNQPREVASTQPSVSYRVTGTDVARADASATNYCRQFNMAAQLQGVQPTAGGNVASYTCSGTVGSGNTGSYYGSSTYQNPNGTYGSSTYQNPNGTYGSSTAPAYGAPLLPCADMLHQNRPGGSDYTGPPVAGCSP